MANTFSTKNISFRSVYSKMEIKDPEEKPKVPVYSGTLLEQLEQHTEFLKSEGKL